VLDAAFLARDAVAVARDLIGCTLELDGCGGRLVEVEAYTRDDPASHSWPGPTARNAAMFGPAGHVYVYRSYGIHWLLNLVCADASAVLVRALVPECGRDRIAARRPGVPERDWCRGPGRLGTALNVGPQHDGLPLDGGPFALHAGSGRAPHVTATRRIGISKAVERPWRFVETGSRYVSSPAGGPSSA
jgi:DNA-3-methyladenine glycosylase